MITDLENSENNQKVIDKMNNSCIIVITLNTVMKRSK